MLSLIAAPLRLAPTTVAVLALNAFLTVNAQANGAGPGATYAGGGGRAAVTGLVGPAATGSNLVTSPSYVPGGEVSAFGFFLNQVVTTPGTTLSYCLTSSALATSVYDAGGANMRCASGDLLAAPSRNGFSAKAGFADFVISDVTLSPGDFASYLANAASSGSPVYGRGQPVQLPAAVTSVGIVYNNPDVPAQLNIGSQQLCQVFAGELTNWNQIDETLPSRPIKLVVRSDASNTSFALTNYFNTVCTTLGFNGIDPTTGDPVAATFGVSQTFSKALPVPLPDGASTRHFRAAKSNMSMARLVGETMGAIGYVDLVETLPLIGGGGKVALVEGQDPVLNLPEAASYVSSFPLLVDQAIGSDVANGRAPMQPLTGGRAGCVLSVDPIATGFPQGYPIVNVSYLLLSSQGNGDKVTSLSRLGSFLSQATTYPPTDGSTVSTPRVTTIDLPSDGSGTGRTGVVAFTPGSDVALAIQAAALSCVAP